MNAIDMTGEAWHHYPEEIPLFHQLAAECETIVNIGVCFGTSVLAFHEGNPAATIYAIDIEPCEEGYANLRRAGANMRRIIPILGDSQTMEWEGTVDCVFIDGAHDRASIERDVANWAGRADKWLVFHDYYNPVCPNVGPDVDDVMAPRKPDAIAGYLAAYRMDDG